LEQSFVKLLIACGLTSAAAFGLPYDLSEGTRIPLSLINSISTKQAVEGDRVYMETAFPILEKGKVIIPVGSYVAGTVTKVKRPGRVKGKAELFIRFDSLTLPNGVTRDFRARIGGLDGQATEKLDREEGIIRGDSNKGGDARTVGEAAGVGTSVGAIAGSVAGRTGMGVGIGAAAGAAAGLVGVLASRGPEAVLPRGSTIEMVLDRTLSFEESELDFSGPGLGFSHQRIQPVMPAAQTQQQRGLPLPGRGIPGTRQQ
jgi:type IV secretion system protein VirB10